MIEPGKLIDYAEFEQLYKKYNKGTLSKTEFALLLGIKTNNYKTIKLSNGAKVKILTGETVDEDEQRNRILKEVSQKLKVGKSINYTTLQELYNPYKSEILEDDFAALLGITYSNYITMRNRKSKAKIKISDYKVYRAKDIIKHQIGNEFKGYISQEEIQQISIEFNISLEQTLSIILDIVNTKTKTFDFFLELLKNKGKVWVGKGKASEEFILNNLEDITNICRAVSKNKLKETGICEEVEDWHSEVQLYLLQTVNDIEMNFSDNKEVLRYLIYLRTKTFITNKALKHSRKVSTISGDQKTIKNNSKEDGEGLSLFERLSDKADVQNIVEKAIMSEESISEEKAEIYIDKLRNFVEQGYDKTQALEKTEEDLGISKEELLKNMQKYLLDKRKVIQGKTGVVWHDDE